jgi:hypothetical protein
MIASTNKADNGSKTAPILPSLANNYSGRRFLTIAEDWLGKGLTMNLSILNFTNCATILERWRMATRRSRCQHQLDVV